MPVPLDPRLRLLIAKRRKEKEVAAPSPPNPNDVHAVPDTWRPRNRPPPPVPSVPEPKPAAVETRAPRRVQPEPSPVSEPVESGPERIPSKKRERKITIAVSAEEEKLIRKFLRERDLSLSSWGRQVLFAAMQVPIPSRY